MNQQPKTIGPDYIQSKVRQLVTEYYHPAASLQENPLLMTTEHVWEQLQKVYPAEYSMMELAVWLEDWGYSMHLTGAMKFEWMLKRKHNDGKN